MVIAHAMDANRGRGDLGAQPPKMTVAPPPPTPPPFLPCPRVGSRDVCGVPVRWGGGGGDRGRVYRPRIYMHYGIICVPCACVMRVRISWVYLYVRVCCHRFGEDFVIRGFVIFQFLCVPWGTAKSRQTVCAELARDAVVCPSLSPTSPNVCIAYMYRDGIAARGLNSFVATLDVVWRGGEIFV